MGYCAAFGCQNNSRTKGSVKTSASFFRFPREKPYRQAWLNYTRRKFKLKEHHRLCSDHFSVKCYSRDPSSLVSLRMSSPYTRPALKNDAIPDVPLMNTCHDGGVAVTEAETTTTEIHLLSRHRRSHVRGAFEKRLRAEVLSNAMDELTQQRQDLEQITNFEQDRDIVIEDTPKQNTQETQTYQSTSNKRVQVKRLPPQRTRCHQTDAQTSTPIFRTFGTQTDPKITNVNVAPVAGVSVVSSEMESEDEEDKDIDMCSEYDPFSDLECSLMFLLL